MGFETEQSGGFGINDAARPAHDRVAVGFNAREIVQRSALFVAERMIHAVDVRVAMHDDDLPGELRGFMAKQLEKFLISPMGKALAKVGETGVCLKQENNAGEFFATGKCEIFLQPGKDDRVAVEKLFRWLAGHAPIVVAARQIYRYEQDRANPEAGISTARWL